MSDHSNSKESNSFSQNFLAAAAAAAASQQGNQANTAQLLQQVFNNNPILQQQQSVMNSNAMASFFANSLAAFQAVQQQQSMNTGHFQGFDPTALINHMAMLSSVSTPQQAAQAQLGVTPEATSTLPTYVNPKQYARIVQRREARRVMDEYFARKRKQREQKKPYMHESRHKHAMKRPRGPGGRFLTKEELEGLKNNAKPEEDYQDDSKPADQDNDNSKPTDASSSFETSGKKPKLL